MESKAIGHGTVRDGQVAGDLFHPGFIGKRRYAARHDRIMIREMQKLLLTDWTALWQHFATHPVSPNLFPLTRAALSWRRRATINSINSGLNCWLNQFMAGYSRKQTIPGDCNL